VRCYSSDCQPFIASDSFKGATSLAPAMMSRNRLAARDRLEARNDDEISRKTDEE
jgi:uncharacterized membrane protein